MPSPDTLVAAPDAEMLLKGEEELRGCSEDRVIGVVAISMSRDVIPKISQTPR